MTEYERYVESVNNLPDDAVLEALEFMLKLKEQRSRKMDSGVSAVESVTKRYSVF